MSLVWQSVLFAERVIKTANWELQLMERYGKIILPRNFIQISHTIGMCFSLVKTHAHFGIPVV